MQRHYYQHRNGDQERLFVMSADEARKEARRIAQKPVTSYRVWECVNLRDGSHFVWEAI